jgi:hypothetical protein
MDVFEPRCAKCGEPLRPQRAMDKCEMCGARLDGGNDQAELQEDENSASVEWRALP